MPAAPAAASGSRRKFPAAPVAAVQAMTQALRRLTKRPQFLRAARGARAQSRVMSLQAIKNALDTDQAPGLGLTVTNKTGNSPERSRIKRRLRAAAAACQDHFRPQYDYVIVGRRQALYEPFDRLVTGLDALLARVHAERTGQDRPHHRPAANRT